MAKKLFNVATEEWVKDFIKKNQQTIFYDLKTDDKTIVGAINELIDLINLCLHPLYDVSAKMYYGIIDPKTVGSITSFYQLNDDIMNKSDLVSTRPGPRSSVKIHDIEVGQYIIIAIPAMYMCSATKDDGFGSKIPFNEDILGANGIDIELFGEDYMIFGEMSIVSGDMTIYIDVTIEDDACDCPEVTIEDIQNIIDNLDTENE